MTPEIISVLTAFAPVFTRPTWKNINTLLIGAILCRGARRITSILRVMGLYGACKSLYNKWRNTCIKIATRCTII